MSDLYFWTVLYYYDIIDSTKQKNTNSLSFTAKAAAIFTVFTYHHNGQVSFYVI